MSPLISRMKAAGRAWWRDEGGATVVESSIIFGLVVLLIFGAIDWSRFYYNQSRVRSAVRRGALYGARLPSSTTDRTTATIAFTRGALVGSNTEQQYGTVAVQYTGTVGNDPRVEVSWDNFPFTRATALARTPTTLPTIVAEFRQEMP